MYMTVRRSPDQWEAALPNRLVAPADHLITTAVAGALARRRGTPVKSNTILVAARRGNIQRAVRHGGRWKFPAWAFEEWLMVHTARADYDPHAD